MKSRLDCLLFGGRAIRYAKIKFKFGYLAMGSLLSVLVLVTMEVPGLSADLSARGGATKPAIAQATAMVVHTQGRISRLTEAIENQTKKLEEARTKRAEFEQKKNNAKAGSAEETAAINAFNEEDQKFKDALNALHKKDPNPEEGEREAGLKNKLRQAEEQLPAARKNLQELLNADTAVRDAPAPTVPQSRSEKSDNTPKANLSADEGAKASSPSSSEQLADLNKPIDSTPGTPVAEKPSALAAEKADLKAHAEIGGLERETAAKALKALDEPANLRKAAEHLDAAAQAAQNPNLAQESPNLRTKADAAEAKVNSHLRNAEALESAKSAPRDPSLANLDPNTLESQVRQEGLKNNLDKAQAKYKQSLNELAGEKASANPATPPPRPRPGAASGTASSTSAANSNSSSSAPAESRFRVSETPVKGAAFKTNDGQTFIAQKVNAATQAVFGFHNGEDHNGYVKSTLKAASDQGAAVGKGNSVGELVRFAQQNPNKEIVIATHGTSNGFETSRGQLLRADSPELEQFSQIRNKISINACSVGYCSATPDAGIMGKISGYTGSSVSGYKSLVYGGFTYKPDTIRVTVSPKGRNFSLLGGPPRNSPRL